MQTHVALAGDGHAERTVTEHLDADEPPAWSADVLLHNLTVYFGHLAHVQFARQHHHIGKLCIEAQRLDVRYVELRGQMHLHANAVAICHHGHVAGYDGGDAGFLGGIHNLVHRVDILSIDDGVYGEVALYAMLIARGGYLPQILYVEVVGGV